MKKFRDISHVKKNWRIAILRVLAWNYKKFIEN